MSRQENAGSPSPLGVYVHVPFCAKTCDFCAFYQETPRGDAVARYLRGVREEVVLCPPERPVETIFWGGGTPGLLRPGELRTLGETLLERGAPPLEWTVELAPASVTDDRLRVLKELGVNRVSMGVQSFQPALLEALGRPHGIEQIYRAYDRLRAACFQSVNLDLIFAVPGQEVESWRADLRQAAALGPDHLSTYCLTFEEDTALWLKLSQGKIRRDPAAETELYEAGWDFLESAGYSQYEISNFARPGHACRHNLNTWSMSEWIGYGPSAASQHAGQRGANPSDLERWLEGLDQGERATVDRTETSQSLLAADRIIFGLRMNAGVAVAEVFPRLSPAERDGAERLAARLAEEGVLEMATGRWRLTRRGRLLADAVGAEFLDRLGEASSGEG